MIWFVGIIFTIVSIAARLVPHIPNVAPVAALALFAGVYLPKRWSLIVPIVAMFISDIFVGFYQWEVMAAVYAGFIITVMIGWQIRSKVKPLNILGGALSGSIIFFLLTNGATWMFTQLYPHTGMGLIDAYTMGLPFFKYSLAGDLAWAIVFFAAYQFAIVRFPQISLARLDSVSPEGIH